MALTTKERGSGLIIGYVLCITSAFILGGFHSALAVGGVMIGLLGVLVLFGAVLGE